jgi:two-component system, chemotaxis family, CheB/CheR fusion protein
MPEEHNANLYQSLYEQVANYFATAGVIIDHNNMIIHFFKDVHKYLRLPEGKASYNLIELADTQLALVISNMLYKLRKERKDVVFTKIRFKQNNQLVFLNLAAHLIQIKRNSRDFIVISFQENNVVELRHSEPSPENYNYDEQVSERIQELERELQYREENLQTTVEELETSNEELQATNEELVAANEELQSTNEELQSVNEELYTVNSQYQEKIIELTTLNNDINNLLANTQIGTLFLDSNLTVRKFTPEITKIINIMEVDVGRPLSHLTFKFKTKINLYQEVEQVLDSLAMREIEINTEDGEWYLLKIQPYRHSDRSIHGILLIQVQITALKQVAASRLKHQELYNLLFETMTQGVIYQDVTGKIFSVNPAAAQILGLDKEQLLGLNFNHPSWRMIRENGTPLPANEHPSLIALNTAQIIKNTVIGIFNPQQEQIRWIKITAIPHFKPNSDTPYQVYSILDDITEQKIAEYRLQQKIQEVQQQQNAKFNAVKLQLNQYMSLINSMPNGLAHYELIKNTNGDVVDFTFITLNQVYSEITGLQANIIGSTAEQISSKIQCNWLEIFTPILLNKQLNEFEYYSILMQQKFTVKIYTPSAGYVATVFIPIS